MADFSSESEDAFAPSGGGSAFDPWTFLATAKRFWWIPAMCLAIALGAGILFVRFSKPEFVSTAEIKVERRAASGAVSLTSGNPLAWEGATAPEDLKTIEKSFISPMLIQRSVASIREGGFETLTFDGIPASDLTDDKLAGFLIKNSEVALIPETRLIQISYKNGDPLMSQQIANLIVNQGIQYDQDQRMASTTANIRYLRDEVKKGEENLRLSEEKLNSYTRTLGNVSIDSDLNIVATQLRELNSRSTIAKADRLRIESDYAQIESCLGDPAKLMKIESIQRMPSIISLSAQIGEVQAKISKLSLRYRSDNPFMLQAEKELKELDASLQNEIVQAPKSVEATLAGARRAEENILREQQLQEEKVIQVRDLAVPSRVLQRQIDADRLTYEAVLKRLSEELSQARSVPVLLQVVNPAGFGFPSGSRPIKFLATALFIGAIIGFGIIFLIMQLDSSIKSPEEAERMLGLSVLSAIPEYELPKEKTSDPSPPRESTFANACPALGDKHSPTAEAVRSLRTTLRSMHGEAPHEVILVTAPLHGDGASFCASNLAVILAQAGQRTLLIDANLREPAIEKMVFQSCGRPGLADFLQSGDNLASVIHPTSVPRLDIIPAGTPCPFPAETLSRQQFESLLAEVKPFYEKIVIDSAALCAVSDTLAFARLFSTVCLAVRSGVTPRNAAKRSIELLRRANVHPTGLIFNSSAVSFGGRLKDFDSSPSGKARTAETSDGGIVCPSCGKTYLSFADLISRTTAALGSTDVRRCSCGQSFHPREIDLRDLSELGVARRRSFGELLVHLQSTGMSGDEARNHLLLTLKFWRNDLPEDGSLAIAKPGDQRADILATLLDRLSQAGLPSVEARQKLLEAVRTWKP